MDCGPKNVDFKSLASFFETIFSALTNKQEQLIVNGREFTVGFVIRLETQQTLWLCLINGLKFGYMKTIAKMGILNYKYLHKFVVLCG